MSKCERCGKGQVLGTFEHRLAMPEMRAMVSHWPWHRVEVCAECLAAYDADFAKQVRRLAPDVLAEEGDVAEAVCLMCGTQGASTVYTPSAKWVAADGAPLATRFSVCQACRGRIVAGSVVSAAELESAGDFGKALAALPKVADGLLRSAEGWCPTDGNAPAGASEVEAGLTLEAAVNTVELFWTTAPAEIAEAAGELVRGAMLKPERKGAIRTHLQLEWRTGGVDDPLVAAMSVYRMEAGYVVVRYGVRKVREM